MNDAPWHLLVRPLWQTLRAFIYWMIFQLHLHVGVACLCRIQRTSHERPFKSCRLGVAGFISVHMFIVFVSRWLWRLIWDDGSQTLPLWRCYACGDVWCICELLSVVLLATSTCEELFSVDWFVSSFQRTGMFQMTHCHFTAFQWLSVACYAVQSFWTPWFCFAGTDCAQYTVGRSLFFRSAGVTCSYVAPESCRCGTFIIITRLRMSSVFYDFMSVRR